MNAPARPRPICRHRTNFPTARAALAGLVLLALSTFAATRATGSDATAPTATPAAAQPATPPATAASRTAPYDLGEGLAYIRVQHLSESLPLLERALSEGKALVVDLRFTQAAEQDSPALALALAQRARSAPLFVLVSPQTPAVLAPVLKQLAPPVLTLGVDGSRPAPAVLVAQPAAADRRAYEALDSGLPLDALITGKIEKERFDEAELVKEFEQGNANAAPPAGPDPSKPAAEKAPALLDRVLQRAVHLHRALAALKRD